MTDEPLYHYPIETGRYDRYGHLWRSGCHTAAAEWLTALGAALRAGDHRG